MSTVRRILTPEEATIVQTALNANGARLKVDGHFGELSQLALIKFQHDHPPLETSGSPDPATCEALGIPPITTPAPTKPRLTPNPVVQAIAGVVANYVINNLILKGTGITMDFAKVSKAIAAAISAATATGAATAGIYITLPPNAQDYLPPWVPVAVTTFNTVASAAWAFWITYSAPANKPA